MVDVNISDLTDGDPIAAGDLAEIERPGSPNVSRKATLGDAAGKSVGTTPGTHVADGRATVGQAEAEAGTATTIRDWTAQRVAQAIAALGGGGWEQILAGQSVGSGSTYAITGLAGYNQVLMTFHGISPDGNSNDLLIQLGIAGPTYRTSGYKGYTVDIKSDFSVNYEAPTDGIFKTDPAAQVEAGSVVHGMLLFTNFGDAAGKTTVIGKVVHNRSGTIYVFDVFSFYDTAEAHDAIRFSIADNFDAGVVDVYAA